jgi:hypothetical protein
MRNQPRDAWEMEAARRREVIESDFGAPHRSQPMPEETDGVETVVVPGPLATWIAGITRTFQARSSDPVECLPHAQPGVRVPKAGT